MFYWCAFDSFEQETPGHTYTRLLTLLWNLYHYCCNSAVEYVNHMLVMSNILSVVATDRLLCAQLMVKINPQLAVDIKLLINSLCAPLGLE